MNRLPASQQGFALLVALMFLIIITLLSVTAMRSSTMELRMSTNEQEYRIGFDSTQSAIDTVKVSNQLAVIAAPGAVSCFGFGAAPNCSGAFANTDLGTTAGAGTTNFVRATLDAIAACPRSRGDSGRMKNTQNGQQTGNCAYFTVESTYDATAQRGSRVETQSGLVTVIN